MICYKESSIAILIISLLVGGLIIFWGMKNSPEYTKQTRYIEPKYEDYPENYYLNRPYPINYPWNYPGVDFLGSPSSYAGPTVRPKQSLDAFYAGGRVSSQSGPIIAAEYQRPAYIDLNRAHPYVFN